MSAAGWRARAAGGLAWAGLLAVSFFADGWAYRTVARGYAAVTGYKPWRFGLPYGARAPRLEEVFLLLKRMGHLYFAVLVTLALFALAPGRRRQAVVLWLAIGCAALFSEGIVRPLVGRVRPDAVLDAAQAARAGPGATREVAGLGRINTGETLFLSRIGGDAALAFPSGHATLAGALFGVLACLFPRGRALFYSLVAGVAVSRVVMGEHFVSDVVAGAGIGLLCARLACGWPRLRRWAEGSPA